MKQPTTGESPHGHYEIDRPARTQEPHNRFEEGTTTILQLMPAGGWRAVFENKDGKFISFRLTSWALMQRCGKTTQEGLVAFSTPGRNVSFAAAAENFERYIHEEDMLLIDKDEQEKLWATGEFS